MREYNLYVIDKQLKKYLKIGILNQEYTRILGKPG